MGGFFVDRQVRSRPAANASLILAIICLETFSLTAEEGPLKLADAQQTSHATNWPLKRCIYSVGRALEFLPVTEQRTCSRVVVAQTPQVEVKQRVCGQAPTSLLVLE